MASNVDNLSAYIKHISPDAGNIDYEQITRLDISS